MISMAISAELYPMTLNEPGPGAFLGNGACALHELDGLSCGFVSLGESWCDTTTDAGRLMLTIMGGIAEFERGLIRKRTDEGIERAKKQGKKFGRPERLDAGQKRVIAERLGKGATIPELAKEYGVGVGTIWRAVNPFEVRPNA